MGQGLERRESPAVFDVVEHRVALAESPALGVLASQPNGDPVLENRGKRQVLGHRPIHSSLIELIERVAAALPRALEFAMDGETFGQGQQAFIQAAKPLGGNGRVGLARGPGWRRLGSWLDQFLLRPERLEDALEFFHAFVDERLGPRRLERASLDKLRRPQCARARVAGDLWIEQRLRECRLVAFVMPPAAVADQVNHKILVE